MRRCQSGPVGGAGAGRQLRGEHGGRGGGRGHRRRPRRGPRRVTPSLGIPGPSRGRRRLGRLGLSSPKRRGDQSAGPRETIVHDAAALGSDGVGISDGVQTVGGGIGVDSSSGRPRRGTRPSPLAGLFLGQLGRRRRRRLRRCRLRPRHDEATPGWSLRGPSRGCQCQVPRLHLRLPPCRPRRDQPNARLPQSRRGVAPRGPQQARGKGRSRRVRAAATVAISVAGVVVDVVGV